MPCLLFSVKAQESNVWIDMKKTELQVQVHDKLCTMSVDQYFVLNNMNLPKSGGSWFKRKYLLIVTESVIKSLEYGAEDWVSVFKDLYKQCNQSLDLYPELLKLNKQESDQLLEDALFYNCNNLDNSFKNKYGVHWKRMKLLNIHVFNGKPVVKVFGKDGVIERVYPLRMWREMYPFLCESRSYFCNLVSKDINIIPIAFFSCGFIVKDQEVFQVIELDGIEYQGTKRLVLLNNGTVGKPKLANNELDIESFNPTVWYSDIIELK